VPAVKNAPVVKRTEKLSVRPVVVTPLMTGGPLPQVKLIAPVVPVQTGAPEKSRLFQTCTVQIPWADAVGGVSTTATPSAATETVNMVSQRTKRFIVGCPHSN